VKKVLMGGLFAAARWFDSTVIDGGVNTFIIQRVIVKNFFAGLSAFDRKGRGRRGKRSGRYDFSRWKNHSESTDRTITVLRLDNRAGYHRVNCRCVYI